MPHCTSQRRHCYAALSYAVLDVTTATILFSRATQFSRRLTVDTKFYTFATSTVEFWLLSILRSSLLIGCATGAALNGSVVASSRLQRILPAFLALIAAVSILAILKLLFRSETDADWASDGWFWGEFAWSFVASILFYTCSETLTQSYENFPANDPPELYANSTPDERQRLMGDANLTFVPSDDDEDKKPKVVAKSSSVWRLIAYSRPDILFLGIAFVFMTISSVAEIFTPWYTGQVIQGIAISKSHAMFTRALVLMSLLAGGSSVAAGIRGGFFRIAMARLNIRIRNRLFASIVTQEVGFFDVTKTGDITSRLTSDTTSMSEALGLNLNVFLRSLIKMIGVCVFMFQLSWRLSMVTVIGLPLIMVVSKVYGTYYEGLSKKVQDSLARANEVAEEVCSSIRTVRSFANELSETLRYADHLSVTYRLKRSEAFAYSGYVWSTQIFSLSLVIATLAYGGHLVIADMLSGGDLVSFVLYQMELGYALESMSDVYTGLMSAVGASNKVFEYIDRRPTVHTDGTLGPPHLDGRLEFRHVSFAYPSRPDTLVLRDVSFTVAPGEVVALVGPSGGGKSSCIHLLEHFYEPLAGEVLLDGVPVGRYDHAYLHSRMALVGQEPVLYARSLRDNIAYGLLPSLPSISLLPPTSILPSAALFPASHPAALLSSEEEGGDPFDEDMEQRVVKAAQLANAHGFISEMRDGYGTETGEKGAQLSGGQKQRVAIARALVRAPRVLLLDEATSALDSESEHAVQHAIYSNTGGRTVVIIAHRLSTVERADRVIVLSKGMVVEQGTHATLLHRPGGLYAKLVQRQMIGAEIGRGAAGGGAGGQDAPRRSSSSPVERIAFRLTPPDLVSTTPPRYGLMRTDSLT